MPIPVGASRFAILVHLLLFHAVLSMEARTAAPDTVTQELPWSMDPDAIELRELVVTSRHRTVLHMLAYVREYSTLSTYSDTVFLFREKMVDYLVPTAAKSKVRGWKMPRVLTSKSYYRFANHAGLDSVSDRCNHHFSWTDWVGVPPPSAMPPAVAHAAHGTDTIRGRYGPVEVWSRRADTVAVAVDIMADTIGRRWVPALSHFFNRDTEFEKFKLRFNYGNITSEPVAPADLTSYSYDIESNGRGHGMFMFNRVDEPVFVETRAEVYILDRQYITPKEARRLEKNMAYSDSMLIVEPMEAPALAPEILELVARVEALDHDRVRLDLNPDDMHLYARRVVKLNVGQKVLQRVKQMFGLDMLSAQRKWNNRWREFRKDRSKRNDEKQD